MVLIMMQVMALIDTASNISFMEQEVLEELTPHLLRKLVPFAKRVQRISEEVVSVKGSLSLKCSIGRWCMSSS